MNHITKLFCLAIFFCASTFHSLKAQDSVEVIAGKEYARGALHRWLWGNHYRKEWKASVTVPIIMLDTTFGGLTPYQAGGGRQSQSLRLHNSNNKEFVLRSIDKSFGRALPEIYQGSFIENILNDQVSIGHPYSALTIAPMAEAAGILHTNPEIGFVPVQPQLDSFNNDFGNKLYLLEQRPDENWEEADNFGNSKNIIGTDKLLEKVLDDNDNLVDQRSFLKSRLFDMVIGDWGRHEDQWRWASFEIGERTIYNAIPRDRDQAYTKFDGVLLGLMLKISGLGHLQTFSKKINDVTDYNYPARNLDRRFLNEPAKNEWLDVAKELQAALTDEVIEAAVHRLPPEVFPISGPQIIAKLKSRVSRLQQFAEKYYDHLAKKVQVVGTKKREYFEVKRLNDEETSVVVYKINKRGEVEGSPLFSRIFRRLETEEVRLFGIEGEDVFKIEGDVMHAVKIRIIGSVDKDSIINNSHVDRGRHLTEVYDNPGNTIIEEHNTKVHISSDTSINAYHYDAYTPDKKGIAPIIFYNNDDKIYVGLGYHIRKNEWRKYPFAYEHKLSVHYSIPQHDYSIWYTGLYNEVIGKWNLALNANYDHMKWTNFYGIGNESTRLTDNVDYYRMRSREWNGGAALNHWLGSHAQMGIGLFYQKVTILKDEDRYVVKNFGTADGDLDPKSFGGIRATYLYQHVNDPAVPTRGINFAGEATYTQNLHDQSRSFANVSGILNTYLPLIGKLGLANRIGGATLTGEPEFYQMNWLGGSNRLRGYRRERFFGKSAVFNNAELQWITNVRSTLFNGKAGLVSFYDVGRVWYPGEVSNTWHTGYGGGIFLAPFNKISVSVTYGISEETRLLHIRINRSLF